MLYPTENKQGPRLELYENKTKVSSSGCKKVIHIEEAKWKNTNPAEITFSFEVKNNKTYVFQTSSAESLKLWLVHLCCISKELYDTKNNVGFDDQGKLDTSALTGDVYATVNTTSTSTGKFLNVSFWFTHLIL